jgi:hypothetical protein
MPFYTGHGDPNGDDFYVEQFRGMFISEDGNSWSNKPLTKNQRLYESIYEHCAKHLRSFEDEYNLIKEKKSTLSTSHREYLIYLIENTKDGDALR